MDRVQQLIEIEAIKRLKARYFRFVDGKDWVNWADVFTADATMTVDSGISSTGLGGNPRPPVVGRDAIVAMTSALFLPHVVTMHHGHMPEIDILSDTEAKGIWAMEDIVEFGDERDVHAHGHYRETYRKEADGKWRIASTHLSRIRRVSLAKYRGPV